MYKRFKDICLPITEDEYRNDGNLHYSTLATYERGGFEALKTLFERKESPSLAWGSLIDCLVTNSREEFDKTYLVAEYPPLEPAYTSVVNAIYAIYKDSYKRLSAIPEADIMNIVTNNPFDLRWLKWKPSTVVSNIKEKGEEYYNLLCIAEGKTVIDTAMYNDALKAVSALKESEATKWYFENDNPFDESIERVYQGKLKSTFEGINYSAMMDLVVIDYENKIIYPCDLKTSGEAEHTFAEHFIKWSYYIQANQYAAIIKDNIAKDDYFKDFKVANYRFIVINRESCNPLVWEWNQTFNDEDITITKKNGYNLKLRNFRTIGKELNHYLTDNSVVPDGISIDKPNDILEWLTK